MGLLSRLFGQAEEAEEVTDFEIVDQEATDEELGIQEGAMGGFAMYAVLCAWCEVFIEFSFVADSHGICSDCQTVVLARHRAQRSR